ncbi:hypothetical protein Hte_012497 [Hypoxylon texense]
MEADIKAAISDIDPVVSEYSVGYLRHASTAWADDEEATGLSLLSFCTRNPPLPHTNFKASNTRQLALENDAEMGNELANSNRTGTDARGRYVCHWGTCGQPHAYRSGVKANTLQPSATNSFLQERETKSAN